MSFLALTRLSSGSQVSSPESHPSQQTRKKVVLSLTVESISFDTVYSRGVLDVELGSRCGVEV